MDRSELLLLRDLHEAVLGNPKTGNEGILARMVRVERELAVHNRKIYIATGIVVTISAVIGVLDVLKPLFSHP